MLGVSMVTNTLRASRAEQTRNLVDLVMFGVPAPKLLETTCLGGEEVNPRTIAVKILVTAVTRVL